MSTRYYVIYPNKSHYSINNHSKYQLVNFRGTLIMLGFLLIMMISNSMLFTYIEPLVKSKGHSIWIVSLCLFSQVLQVF